MIYTSIFTAREIDSILSINTSPEYLQALIIVSASIMKGCTLTCGDFNGFVLLLTDKYDNIVAGVDSKMNYIGLPIDDAVEFINSITNN